MLARSERTPGFVASSAIDAALCLRKNRPDAPALSVLDAVFMEARAGQLGLDQLHPASAFGQLVAAAFDSGNSPIEWALWTQPPADPALSAAMMTIWNGEVLERFALRYRLPHPVGAP